MSGARGLQILQYYYYYYLLLTVVYPRHALLVIKNESPITYQSLQNNKNGASVFGALR